MRVLIAGFLLLMAANAAAQTAGLTLGQRTTFALPANAYTTGLHVDIPPGTTKIKVELDNDSGDEDLDLFLRFGSRFTPLNAYGQPMSLDELSEQAHYYAISGGDEEAITVGRSNKQPARGGRWYLAVVSFAPRQINARIKVEATTEAPKPVEFQVRFDLPASDCDIAPWNDPTPVTPVGGNPGTTRGEQRRNAMIESLRQLAAGFDSETPIIVRGCWDNLNAEATGATLAAASPDNFLLDDNTLVFSSGGSLPAAPYLPSKYAFYSSAPASRLGGTRACALQGGSCASVTDMTITYNKRIGEPGVLGGAQYYLGYNAVPPGSVDFVGVSVHELGHGLGFISLVRLTANNNGPVGSLPFDRDDIFARQMVDNRVFPNPQFTRLTNAQRADVMVGITGLSWIDDRAANSPQNTPSGYPGVLMFTPNPIRPGSSVSHLSEFYIGQLMTPSLGLARGNRQLGLGVPMLYAAGWDPAPTSPPTYAAPYSGLWYDRDRDGHGFDFQRVRTDANGYDVYTLAFYTYDAQGRPEWYLALGSLIDGVFQAGLTAGGQSLLRYRYVAPGSPSQVVADQSGTVRLDFNQAADSPACRDGTSRAGVGTLGSLRFTLGGQTAAWCIEELVPRSQRPGSDLTGTWYAGEADAGWGASVATVARAGGGRFLFKALYFPDATNAGRWAYGSADNYTPGQTIPVFERRGYCRSCPVSLTDTQIGTMTVNLTQPIQGPSPANRVSFDVTYTGPEGGRFTRSNSPYELLTAPNQ